MAKFMLRSFGIYSRRKKNKRNTIDRSVACVVMVTDMCTWLSKGIGYTSPINRTKSCRRHRHSTMSAARRHGGCRHTWTTVHTVGFCCGHMQRVNTASYNGRQALGRGRAQGDARSQEGSVQSVSATNDCLYFPGQRQRSDPSPRKSFKIINEWKSLCTKCILLNFCHIYCGTIVTIYLY